MLVLPTPPFPLNSRMRILFYASNISPGAPTETCATLKSVRTHKNVTLSLPEPLLRRFKVYAAAKNRSMSSMMKEAMSKLIEQDEDQEKAKLRFLESLRNAPDLGTKGRITWTRDE